MNVKDPADRLSRPFGKKSLALFVLSLGCFVGWPVSACQLHAPMALWYYHGGATNGLESKSGSGGTDKDQKAVRALKTKMMLDARARFLKRVKIKLDSEKKD